MADILDVAKEVSVTAKNGRLNFEVPSWVLLVLVLGGIATNAFNVYLAKQQIDAIKLAVAALDVRITEHAKRPAHDNSVDLFNRLLDRMEHSEAER